MKATIKLEYDSVEDRQSINNAVNADAFMYESYEFKNWLRHIWKYEDMTKESSEDLIDRIYERYCNLYAKYDLEEI